MHFLFVAGFTVTESAGSTVVSESGTTDTFTVVLTGQPATDVVLDVTSGDTAEVTVGPAQLTFTNANWNVAQTVTCTGVADTAVDGTTQTHVTVAVNAAGSDAQFDALAAQRVVVATTDVDVAGGWALGLNVGSKSGCVCS